VSAWSRQTEDGVTFSDLVGQTLIAIEGADVGSRQITLRTAERSFRMFHYSECCERVDVSDVVGDMADLIGSPIVQAEEVSREATSEEAGAGESGTWTFYKLSTVKGSVTISWLGTSNGYYSERVDFEALP